MKLPTHDKWIVSHRLWKAIMEDHFGNITIDLEKITVIKERFMQDDRMALMKRSQLVEVLAVKWNGQEWTAEKITDVPASPPPSG